MIYAYAYSHDVLLPLAATVLLALLSWYSWRRRRSLPAALPLAVGSLFGALWTLGLIFEAAATVPGARLAWHRFQSAWQLPAATAMACFALEYIHPGRWLTRRNLVLLSLPSLLFALIVVVNDPRFAWGHLETGPDGSVVRSFTVLGLIIAVYGLGLGLVNVATFLWLFIRSPQHRWPTALMLCGDVACRSVYALYAFDPVRLPGLTLADSFVATTLLYWVLYAAALFGFRLFDPLPAARATAIRQMREGMVVFDVHWRVASLNPAAASMLATSAARARGKSLVELLPDFPDLSARLAMPPVEANPTEISLGAGPNARLYALGLSVLQDFRGLVIGHLLLLHDVTEQRRAQAQLLEQRTAMAALAEREQMARELHDGLGQVLGYIKMQAQAARSLMAQERPAEADRHLAQLVAVAQDVHADVREYIFAASSASPIELGFSKSLQQYLERFGQNHAIRTELSLPPELTDEPFEPRVAVQMLCIIQEALTNAAKHAHATQVRVTLTARDCIGEVVIADDGQGFDPGRGGTVGFGLRFMQERADAIGGNLRVCSAPGQGAQIVVQAPLKVNRDWNRVKDGGL